MPAQKAGRDLYEILGIQQRNAPLSAIRTAYRQKVQHHHPNKGGDPDLFEEIREAYGVLVNSQRRAHYDTTGEILPMEAVEDGAGGAATAATARPAVATERPASALEPAQPAALTRTLMPEGHAGAEDAAPSKGQSNATPAPAAATPAPSVATPPLAAAAPPVAAAVPPATVVPAVNACEEAAAPKVDVVEAVSVGSAAAPKVDREEAVSAGSAAAPKVDRVETVGAGSVAVPKVDSVEAVSAGSAAAPKEGEGEAVSAGSAAAGGEAVACPAQEEESTVQAPAEVCERPAPKVDRTACPPEEERENTRVARPAACPDQEREATTAARPAAPKIERVETIDAGPAAGGEPAITAQAASVLHEEAVSDEQVAKEAVSDEEVDDEGSGGEDCADAADVEPVQERFSAPVPREWAPSAAAAPAPDDEDFDEPALSLADALAAAAPQKPRGFSLQQAKAASNGKQQRLEEELPELQALVELDGARVYRCSQGVLIAKRSVEPTGQTVVKLPRPIGDMVYSTGRHWKGPGGATWCELAPPIVAKARWALVKGPGFGLKGPALLDNSVLKTGGRYEAALLKVFRVERSTDRLIFATFSSKEATMWGVKKMIEEETGLTAARCMLSKTVPGRVPLRTSSLDTTERNVEVLQHLQDEQTIRSLGMGDEDVHVFLVYTGDFAADYKPVEVP